MENLINTDKEIAELVKAEQKRQAETLMMIPSENHTSLAVREVVGSLLQDKYCEGYPYKRYYQGQENFDKIETICIERVKKAFDVPFANVQPLSGAPANSAVYFALLEQGDKIMGLRLDQGGHISHGLKINFSGKFFTSAFYNVDKNGFIDYEKLAELVQKEKPKIIIAGITSYPRVLDFKKFSEIAESIDAYLMADIAHVSGLVLAGAYPNPVDFAHIITTTTHKTLRGPRGALIMATKKGIEKDPDLPEKINKAVFPGLQGGPHENNIAGIAVALKEAEKPEFDEYGKQIVKNAICLAEGLKKNSIKLCSDGTDTHLILIDLTSFDILGNTIAEALESAGIVVNRNTIPYDHNSAFYPSGIRLGTPAITSRGMKEQEMEKIADFIAEVIKDVSQTKKQMNLSIQDEKKSAIRKQIISNSQKIPQIKEQVSQLCVSFPLPTIY